MSTRLPDEPWAGFLEALDVLVKRYEDELRLYLGRPDREDLTMRLWIEMIREGRLAA